MGEEVRGAPEVANRGSRRIPALKTSVSRQTRRSGSAQPRVNEDKNQQTVPGRSVATARDSTRMNNDDV